jgi:hypothetical protein
LIDSCAASLHAIVTYLIRILYYFYYYYYVSALFLLSN